MNALHFARGTAWTAVAHAMMYAVTLSLFAAGIGAAVAGVGLKHLCIY